MAHIALTEMFDKFNKDTQLILDIPESKNQLVIPLTNRAIESLFSKEKFIERSERLPLLFQTKTQLRIHKPQRRFDLRPNDRQNKQTGRVDPRNDKKRLSFLVQNISESLVVLINYYKLTKSNQ